MLTASDIAQRYISFFKKYGHTQIPTAPLVLQNDPTTLFTSSGMQPLVPYLLGEEHPQGTRLVNSQNSFRAVDIDEVGDNRHTTFFRMLGNWSLGDYFKKEQIPWIWEFVTKELGLAKEKLYITVFKGNNDIPRDEEATKLWTNILNKEGLTPEERISFYDVDKNWWSRSGTPDKMPPGEPGGPDTEIFYDFGDPAIHDNSPFKNEYCHVNCDCGRYIEICNSVFMQYQKQTDGTFKELPKQNVDFGGGLERFLMAVENQQDIFKTNLFSPIIKTIEKVTTKKYEDNSKEMRIIADHLISATFIASAGVKPSKTEQGYILRRLIRRSFDNLQMLKMGNEINNPISEIIKTIIEQYKETDPYLVDKFVEVESTILEETGRYRSILVSAKKSLDKELIKKGVKVGDELFGNIEIPADLAFKSAATLGLGPTQLKSLGYLFDDQAYAEEVKKHRQVSRAGLNKKFRGGLADQEEKTIKGHTATHLLHKALRDILGNHVYQTGSNITTERVRFDFNYEEKLTDEQMKKVENTVNEKINQNLPVHYEMLPTEKAKKIGAIGLFADTYAEVSKIYFIGDTTKSYNDAYSIEFCGGPHVDFTGKVKSFKIIKQENLGKNQKRLYAIVGD